MSWFRMIPVAVLVGLATPAVAVQDTHQATEHVKKAQHTCECKQIKTTGNGWCDPCEQGAVLGLSTRSEKVYVLLAGSPAPEDLEEIECTECVVAVEKDGVCKSCKVGVADGRVYHSMYAYTLAKGKEIPRDQKIDCEGCAKAVKDEQGFCDHCDGGVVAHRFYKSKKGYDKAVQAYEVVVVSVKTSAKCEPCAVAMLTDGECEHCSVKFKQGKKIG